MADIDYQDYETAKDYYGKAKSCIDDGSSDACKDLAKEGGEKALIAAGVDPQLAHEAMECAESRDSEVCAKASAKLAAVYACTSATGGSGYTLCNELAPRIVDQVWPVAGPPLVMAWDSAFAILDGVTNALKGIVDALGGILGFGSDDGPTKTELQNEMMWKGSEILFGAIQSAMNATAAADFQSKIELGLPVDLPIGQFGTPNMWAKPKPGAQLSSKDDFAKRVMSESLRRQPSFGAIAVAARTRVGWMDEGPLDFHFVDPGSTPASGEVILLATECPSNWTIGNSQWNPAGFKMLYNDSSWNLSDVGSAYGMVLAERAAAIRDAASESVGHVVAYNLQMSQGPTESEGGIGWFWWAAIIGGGVLAYVNRAKIARAAKRLTR